MKRTMIIVFLVILLTPNVLYAVEKAPRISDKEIIESLTALKEGQKSLNKRIDDLDRKLNKRIDDLLSNINSRFIILQWMFGLFITISIVILGFVLRMQWQMHRRLTQVETSLETQKDEIAFLKSLIEKLFPPKEAFQR